MVKERGEKKKYAKIPSRICLSFSNQRCLCTKDGSDVLQDKQETEGAAHVDRQMGK